MAESTDIFFPIFQLGCLIAEDTLILLNFDNGKFKKGPPDAVKIISSMLDLLTFLINDHIEKCSESTGMKFVLCFFNFYSIKFHPQIKDSLLAMAIFLVNLIVSIVGNKPCKPEIAHIV